MTVAEFNALDTPRAVEELIKCCGSIRWALMVAQQRPFKDGAALYEAAAKAWAECGATDWLQAFSQHPRIGDAQAIRRAGSEQSQVAAASDETLWALERANREYERKFGHIFIVCAAGRSAEQMLQLVAERLGNDPENELRIAAMEQARITQLRLRKAVS